MQFSIYKLTTSKSTFIEMLTRDYDMEQIGETQKNNLKRRLEKEDFEYTVKSSFYFKNNSNDRDIKWYDYWSSFFQTREEIKKIIETSYGVVVIEVADKLYAISLGAGYHYANKVAEEDFGFDIAERIIKVDEIALKSVKFYKQTKTRSLTQYNHTFASNEVGESNEVVIGKLEIISELNDWLLKDYTDNAVFATPIKINAEEYDPLDVLELVFEFHILYNSDIIERKTSFPRLKVIKNNEDNQALISDLNKVLLEDLMSGNKNDISLSYFTELDGDIFVQPFHSEVELIYRRKNEKATFNIASIGKVLSELKCDNIENVTVRSFESGQQDRSLKKVLDFSVHHKDGENYCLFNGNWATFNQSYLEFIENEILKVNDIAEYDESFNLYDKTLEQGNTLILENQSTYKVKKPYREYKYNVFLAESQQLKLYDRVEVHDVFKNVEFADLYNPKSKELIHVKIGDTPEWRYCLDQSSQVAPLLNLHRHELNKSNLPEVETLTLLLIVNVKNIFREGRIDLQKNKSVYFKTEVIEWYNVVTQYGFKPKIVIAKNMTIKKDS